MEPEHLGPEEAARVKFHLASMTAAMSAAKSTTDPVESQHYWALYRQHQAEVDRLLPPDPNAQPPR